MRRFYDVFEKIPDGSPLWRACVSGRFEAERKMHELAEHSGNEFFLMNVEPESIPPTAPPRRNSRPISKKLAG